MYSFFHLIYFIGLLASDSIPISLKRPKYFVFVSFLFWTSISGFSDSRTSFSAYAASYGSFWSLLSANLFFLNGFRSGLMISPFCYFLSCRVGRGLSGFCYCCFSGLQQLSESALENSYGGEHFLRLNSRLVFFLNPDSFIGLNSINLMGLFSGL